MEFTKVAEGEGVEVHQAVHRIARAQEVEETDEKGRKTGSMKTPVLTQDALVPFLPEAITESITKQVHRAFAGRQVLAMSISTAAGISVRVLPLTCRSCGEPLQDAHRFCPSCGIPVEEV